MVDSNSCINKNFHKARIVLASCYPMISETLTMHLEKQQDLEIIAETRSSRDAINLAVQLNPDLIILDVDMPVTDGYEATKKIKEVSPNTKVLIFTLVESTEELMQIKKVGADGYITKKATIDMMMGTIRKVISSLFLYSLPVVSNDVLSSFQDTGQLSKEVKHLTYKEVQILKSVAQGQSNKSISKKFDITLSNVKSTLSMIYNKLNVHTRTEAISIALKRGIIVPLDLVQ